MLFRSNCPGLVATGRITEQSMPAFSEDSLKPAAVASVWGFASHFLLKTTMVFFAILFGNICGGNTSFEPPVNNTGEAAVSLPAGRRSYARLDLVFSLFSGSLAE